MFWSDEDINSVIQIGWASAYDPQFLHQKLYGLLIKEWPPLVSRKQQYVAIVTPNNQWKEKTNNLVADYFYWPTRKNSISPTPQVKSVKGLLNIHVKIITLLQNTEVKQMVPIWVTHSKDLKFEILSINTVHSTHQRLHFRMLSTLQIAYFI